MKIFLAGATGVVGRLLLPLLVEAGHDVAGTTRSANKQGQIIAMGGRPVLVDALDRDSMFAALNDERPDVVIHQLTDLSARNFGANSQLRIDGTRNLVDAALKVGVERMIAQSISWVCVPGEKPAHEDELLDLEAAPPRRRTIAAVQSLEQTLLEMPVGVVLRYGLLYGPDTWYSRSGLTTEQIRRGEITASDAVTSFLHVSDAAQAAVPALNWPAGAVNIVDDTPAAGREWVPLYAKLVGAPAPPIQAGRQGWERGESNAKARQLGWNPQYPTWREGFKSVLG
jgi:nucleoside-diphosphate-sugar epimerase